MSHQQLQEMAAAANLRNMLCDVGTEDPSILLDAMRQRADGEDIDPDLLEELEEIEDEVFGHLIEHGINPNDFRKALARDPDGFNLWVANNCFPLTAEIIPFG